MRKNGKTGDSRKTRHAPVQMRVNVYRDDKREITNDFLLTQIHAPMHACNVNTLTLDFNEATRAMKNNMVTKSFFFLKNSTEQKMGAYRTIHT